MADLTHNRLKQAATALARNITRSAEAIHAHARHIDEEATDTGRVADLIAGMKVDTATIAETRDLSKLMSGVSQAAVAYASAGDTTAKAAKAAHDQARVTHDGIQEAVNRSTADGIHDVHRDWLQQE